MFSTKKSRESKNRLFNAYAAGLKNDRGKDAEAMYKELQNNSNSYDDYKARMETVKSAKKNESAVIHRDSEDEKARLNAYKSSKEIIDIWNSIKEEIANRISMGIIEGPPKMIYIEFKSEDNNVTAVVTRNKPICKANEREVIYTSNSYEIPGEFNEESAVRALTDLCNESLYGQNLIFIV